MKRARGKHQRVKTQPQRAVKKKKNNNGQKKSRIFLYSFIAIIAFIFIALGFGGGTNNSLIPIDNSTGKINVLLLGVDEDGLRTDAIMVASYDFDDDTLDFLSIPRDTRVVITNRNNLTRKINEVHAMTDKNGKIMGPMASVEAVTALTGIPIHYYVEFTFDAIDNIMNILGPVTYDVPDIEGNGKGMNYDDLAQDLHIHLKPGLQELSGDQVQQFLRYRKSNSGRGDGSDTSRVERQQDFIKAVLEQKVNMSLVVKAPSIFSQVKKDIKTNFSSAEIAKYATHLLSLSSENISSYSLPGEDKHTSAWYFECNLEETQMLIETEIDASYGKNITNKMAITGLKSSLSDIGKTPTPTEDDDEPSPSPTEEPEESPSPSPEETPDDEPEETPTPTRRPTQTPTKTVEPLRPTAKPTQEPDDDDDTIVID